MYNNKLVKERTSRLREKGKYKNKSYNYYLSHFIEEVEIFQYCIQTNHVFPRTYLITAVAIALVTILLR